MGSEEGEKRREGNWTALLSKVSGRDNAPMLEEAGPGEEDPWRARVLSMEVGPREPPLCDGEGRMQPWSLPAGDSSYLHLHFPISHYIWFSRCG